MTTHRIVGGYQRLCVNKVHSFFIEMCKQNIFI